MSDSSSGQALDHANVVVIPPVLHIVAILLGVAAYWWVRLEFPVDFVVRAPLGIALLGAGLTTTLWFFRTFRRAGQSVDPNSPTQRVLTTGLYRYSRNPAYAALVATHAGIALLLDNVWILLMLVPALVIMHYGVILREEAYLERKFGDEYLHYKANVRRWL